MTGKENLDELRKIRNKLGKIYESEVSDDVYDNSNLTTLNNVILGVETLIKEMKKRVG